VEVEPIRLGNVQQTALLMAKFLMQQANVKAPVSFLAVFAI
jgi:hypothetical protein